MSLFWRKSVKLAPGVRLTFSKRGASVSGGPRGVKVGVNSRGRKRASVSWRGITWRRSR